MYLSSNNKKILIVSDIHMDIEKLKKIIKHEDADINLVLGDWFDSFYIDDNSDYRRVTKYLKEEFFTSENNITLMGNHDVHYLYDNHWACCSGFEQRKYDVINEAIESNREDFAKKFKWFVWVDDYLCSHAGLHPMHMRPYSKTDKESISEYLYMESNQAILNLGNHANTPHWFYGAGRARGGRLRRGGLTWLDFDYEFEPIEGIKQIVGHTNRESGTVEQHHLEGFGNVAEANNICIDTFLNEYVIVQYGKLFIKKYIDL
jgi:hypothetical protein